MRRIAVAVMGTITGLVMLFSYHTSTNSGTAVAGGGSTGSTGGTDDTGASGGTGSTGNTGSSSSGGSAYTGDEVMTRWGAVQVQITMVDGKITKSEAVEYPTENPRDQEINAYAVPQLNQEVIQQQSGSIDAVSGATVTSDGYIQSLQSAIDQANP